MFTIVGHFQENTGNVVARLVAFGAWTIADQKRIQLAKAPAKDSNTKSNAAA